MSNKQTASDSEMHDIVSKNNQEKTLTGLDIHRNVYKEFYDYVDKHERRYSKPRNFAKAGCAVAVVSAIGVSAFMNGATPLDLAMGGTILAGAAYLYGLNLRSNYRTADNCRLVIGHHNLVIDYLNNNGMVLDDGEPIEHNQSFPVDFMEEVDYKSLSTYVNGELEKQKRNREAARIPAIVDKPARPNREGRQIIYSNKPR